MLPKVTLDWNAVLAATVTALVVTMAVEYLAKPRLEARKERILGAIRTRQELLASIMNLSLAAEAFGSLDMPKGLDPEARDAFMAERQRQYGRMQELAQQLFDDAGKYAGTYLKRIRNLVLEYVVCVYGVMLSGRTRARKAEIVKGLGEPIARVLEHQWWQIPAAVRALFEVKRRIAEIQAPDQGADDRAVEGASVG